MVICPTVGAVLQSCIKDIVVRNGENNQRIRHAKKSAQMIQKAALSDFLNPSDDSTIFWLPSDQCVYSTVARIVLYYRY
jgi:hypothetical protein